MSDQVITQFFANRTKPLFDRFTGRFRAVVVETNDPLRMHRVRFKIPELHDWGLRADQCPWAVPSHDMGAMRSGRWSHPCINDWVWIEFEKNHPYGPVWTGFATPTRRKMYQYPSIYGATPVPVTKDGEVDAAPQDYAIEYLPKDQRPMSHGWQDRYGNLDIHSSVGFYPASHLAAPPPAGTDNLSKSSFNQSQIPPVQNNPDSKFMARVSKYGNIILQSDVGYLWQDLGKKFVVQTGTPTAYQGVSGNGQQLVESDSGTSGELQQYSISVTSAGGIISEIIATGMGEFVAANEQEAIELFRTRLQSALRDSSTAYNQTPVRLSSQWAGSITAFPTGESVGEFTGDFDTDEQYEIDRWKYMQRLIHEDEPTGKDQRRIMMLSRYGHKFEMRDVGWDKTRVGEYTNSRQQIGPGGVDQRWFKMRTKGGHLIELSDIGSDPVEDEFVKRNLIDEVTNNKIIDEEDKFGSDARFIRLITRSGIKFALDDRTSHTTKAHDASLTNNDIGTGAIIKGRATPGTKCDGYADKSGDPRGFFWEFDERPNKNSTTWGTPLGQMIEMDDNNESIILCSRLPDKPESWHYLDDLEFLENSVSDDINNAVHNTHHLAINHSGEWIRLKTRAGRGTASVCKSMGDAGSGVQQGLEIHDAPADDPWVELVDIENRGLWFSKSNNIGIWRAKDGTDMSIWIDDSGNKIVIKNDTSGKIQISCSGDIDIKGKNVNIQADENVSIKAGNGINMGGGGGKFAMNDTGFDSNMDIRARNIYGYYPQIRQGDGGPPGTPSGTGGRGPIDVIPESSPSSISPSNRI